MSNLSELLPAGAGAKSATFVASGTLASGQTVALKSNGQVEVVTGTAAVVSNQVQFGAPTDMTTCSYDKTTNKIFIAYVGASEYGTMVVGSVSGGTISFGTPVVFYSGQVQYPGSCFHDATGKVFLAYGIETEQYGIANMISISGTTPTKNADASFPNSARVRIYPKGCAYDSSTQRVFVFYMALSSSNYGYGVTASVSGTTISFGQANSFNSATTQELSAAYDVNANKTVVVYQDSGNGTVGNANVCTMSGTGFSIGTKANFNSGYTFDPSICYDPDNQNLIVACHNTGSGQDLQGTACIGTISGTDITFTAQQVFGTSAKYPSLSYDTTNNKMIVGYANNSSSNKFEVIVISSTGSTLSFGTALASNATATTTFTSSAFDPDTGAVVFSYSSGNGKAAVFSPLVTNSTSFIGITDEAISSGASGAVIVQGGVNSKVTSLTIGSDYYVQVNGTLSTTTSTVPAGRALTNSSILLEG